MVNLGKKLKSLRLAENLTQAQVAGQIGVTKTVISSYENDLRQPSYDNLLKLASLFKVSTDWLLGNEKAQKFDFSGLQFLLTKKQPIITLVLQLERLLKYMIILDCFFHA